MLLKTLAFKGLIKRLVACPVDLVSRYLKGLFVLCAWLWASPALADYAINLPKPVTQTGRDIYDLHMLIFWICLGILALVSAVMFYSIFRHRKRKGHVAAHFTHSTKMEIVWTIIPTLILIAMAIPSTATLIKMEDSTEADMAIKVTAYQWKWEYEYMDSGVRFFSNLSTPREQIEGVEEKGEHYLLEVDNHVVIPSGKKVRFVMTSNDVIHAWWIPEFGAKKDAIPGFVNEFWVNVDEGAEGTYRGVCAELCGKDHGFMPIVVDVVTQDQYDTWVSEELAAARNVLDDVEREWALDELIDRGESIYVQCVACHGSDGTGVPGVFPAIAGSAVVNGPVEDHLSLVMDGKAGTAMVAFRQQLNDIDLAAIVAYQRNAFGNQAEGFVQPRAVRDIRNSSEN